MIIHRSNIPHSLSLFAANNNCCSHSAGFFLKITFAMVICRLCHSIFALSLTRFAFRNPNGITYGYATFDLLLQNLSITKRCFVILERRVTERRISKFALIDIVDFVSLFLETFLFEILRYAQDDRYAQWELLPQRLRLPGGAPL